MKKAIKIKNCLTCPYYSFNFEQCKMLAKEWTSYGLIPAWCPLDDASEEEIKNDQNKSTLLKGLGSRKEYL